MFFPNILLYFVSSGYLRKRDGRGLTPRSDAKCSDSRRAHRDFHVRPARPQRFEVSVEFLLEEFLLE